MTSNFWPLTSPFALRRKYDTIARFIPNLPKAFAELRLSPESSADSLALQKIAPLIHEIRGERVILDADLALIYGVSTKRLNEQVKRNRERFPDDFMFQLTTEEATALQRSWSQIATSSSRSLPNRSQFATCSQKHRDPRYRPYAFTEHEAIMAANVLNSKQAVQMSVFVGSSNFTQSGLIDNLEFNVELKNPADYHFALDKFNELWERSVEVTKTYVDAIQKRSPYAEFMPYELYLKFLYEYFKGQLNLPEEIEDIAGRVQKT